MDLRHPRPGEGRPFQFQSACQKNRGGRGRPFLREFHCAISPHQTPLREGQEQHEKRSSTSQQNEPRRMASVTVSKDELRHLAAEVQDRHGHVATSAAGLIASARTIFANASLRTGSKRALLALLEVCVFEWAERKGSSRSDVERAISALSQAGSTAQALDALPDEVVPPVFDQPGEFCPWSGKPVRCARKTTQRKPDKPSVTPLIAQGRNPRAVSREPPCPLPVLPCPAKAQRDG